MSETEFRPLAEPSSKRGLALFEEIVAEIEASEFSTWDQTSWIGHRDEEDPSAIPLETLTPEVRERMIPAFDCGTVCCLFGHAVFKAGARLAPDEFDDNAVDTSMIVLPGSADSRAYVADYAQELLGLPTNMARWLSNANREWAQITEFLRAWQQDEAAGPERTDHRMAVIVETFLA